MPEIDYGQEELRQPVFARTSLAADEALIRCVNTCGMVDLPEMSRLSGLSAVELVRELGGVAIFQDPAEFVEDPRWDETRGWLLAPRYLSGNIVKKLELAQSMNPSYLGAFDSNIAALRRLLPKRLRFEEIHASMGARWIPAEVYAEFIADLLASEELPEVYFNPDLAVWKIKTRWDMQVNIANTFTYGTGDMPALKIIEHTMNARTVKVFNTTYHYDGSVERIPNRAKTTQAQEKQRLIMRKFEEWLSSDEDRRRRLQDCYNNAFVGVAFSPYDGRFLQLPGLNPEVRLFDHQRSAVARILLSGGNVLLAHDVGAGKTYEMIVSAHELHRMGLSRSNLIVVPNNVLKATVEAHRLLYPEDKLLTIFPRDFVPEKRDRILRELRDGDHVCAYIAYSSFDMIEMSKKYMIDRKRERIEELRRNARLCSRSDMRRALRNEADTLQNKLEKFIRDAKQTPWMHFEELGIDTLFVDEAHNYKNIPMQTHTDNIVGMHSAGSKKCAVMLEKCRCAKRVIFSTGTPLTNSLADLFVLQTYLQPEMLKYRGIDNFDMWINTFACRDTTFEVDVDARSLRPVTRFSTFHNLPELMSLFSVVCDFHQTESGRDKLPDFDGYRDITVPKGPAQKAYLELLAKRTEEIRAGRVNMREDNLLKVTGDGRACALDIRLTDLYSAQIPYSAEDYENCKVRACAEQVKRVYDRFPGACQIVFSDIGTPKESFNVYDALRGALEFRGIPREEIAYVHDAASEKARAELFAAMNAGRLRVVIGSTEKLGVGVNVQERLIAMHHLSVPWRPADMVQREGRILRRGNTCEKVYIFRYVTEGSFDSYSWQLLQNKQRFISAFLSGSAGEREQQDIADVVLSYSEIKALAIGDPLVKTRVELANRLERERTASRQRQKQLLELRDFVDKTPEKLARLAELRERAKASAAVYAKAKRPIPRELRQDFGERLLAALRGNELCQTERFFDSYMGFLVILPAAMRADKPFVYVRVGDGKYSVEMEKEGKAKELGCSMRIDRMLEDLPARADRFTKQIEETEKQRDNALAEMDRGNPHEDAIAKMKEELDELDRKLNLKEDAA